MIDCAITTLNVYINRKSNFSASSKESCNNWMSSAAWAFNSIYCEAARAECDCCCCKVSLLSVSCWSVNMLNDSRNTKEWWTKLSECSSNVELLEFVHKLYSPTVKKPEMVCLIRTLIYLRDINVVKADCPVGYRVFRSAQMQCCDVLATDGKIYSPLVTLFRNSVPHWLQTCLLFNRNMFQMTNNPQSAHETGQTQNISLTLSREAQDPTMVWCKLFPLMAQCDLQCLLSPRGEQTLKKRPSVPNHVNRSKSSTHTLRLSWCKTLVSLEF